MPLEWEWEWECSRTTYISKTPNGVGDGKISDTRGLVYIILEMEGNGERDVSPVVVGGGGK